MTAKSSLALRLPPRSGRKVATVPVAAMLASLRREANAVFGALPRDLATSVWNRAHEVSYACGRLLGIRAAAYALRMLVGIHTDEWRRIDALCEEISKAHDWCNTGTRHFNAG